VPPAIEQLGAKVQFRHSKTRVVITGTFTKLNRKTLTSSSGKKPCVLGGEDVLDGNGLRSLGDLPPVEH
jgi:hypothetical protein